MKFYSTNNADVKVDLKEAVMNGLAPDGGLYMPEYIPKLENNFFKKTDGMSFTEITMRANNGFFIADINNDFADLKNFLLSK